ncbi:flagellar biosynthetic protein FliO [Alkalihalobacillus hwajinpoensis]|uniref:flagellar biosynthetic protein FliO n=1 Tax=Guptibacillus hwajinpoensis TaxID=208199 RepID=UPI00188486FD|nr:flagellar biosynthetic protein FliO [Pseudalkalibacillus hwajinpoensis]MBF0705169.1 flagellar biosynthetic protein FliO [Pseudalkalibacillus hwajinpoensis]
MRQHMIGIMTLLLCFVLLVPHHVVAATDGSVTDWLTEDGDEPSAPQDEQPTEVEGPSTNVFFLLIKLVFYTIVVVGLIYLLIRFLSKRQQKIQHHSVFTPIGGTSLGNNKSVQMVKVGDSLYMIGVGDNVNLLKEIEDKEEVERILSQAEDQKSGFSFMNQKHAGIQEMIQASLKKQRNKRKNYWDDGDERDDK